MQNRTASLVMMMMMMMACPATAAEPGRPLSAIDWLSRSVETPAVSADPGEPAVAPGAALPGAMQDEARDRLPPEISARPIGPPEPETGGLVAAGDLGLPGDR